MFIITNCYCFQIINICRSVSTVQLQAFSIWFNRVYVGRKIIPTFHFVGFSFGRCSSYKKTVVLVCFSTILPTTSISPTIYRLTSDKKTRYLLLIYSVQSYFCCFYLFICFYHSFLCFFSLFIGLCDLRVDRLTYMNIALTLKLQKRNRILLCSYNPILCLGSAN